MQIDGSGTFKWSLDGGATFQATGVAFTAGGAAVALGSTGISVTFPNGTYNTTHTYSATVASWAGVKGVHTFVQALAAKQPQLLCNALNGKRGLKGSNSRGVLMTCGTLVLAAAGTTPTFIRALVKQDAWTLGNRLWGGMTLGVDALQCLQGPSTTPQIELFNATPSSGNAGAAIGSAKRVRALYNNAATDYLTVGSVNVTGTNTGNNGSGASGMALFSSQDNVPGDVTIYDFAVANIAPSGGQLASLDTEASTRYGAGVLT